MPEKNASNDQAFIDVNNEQKEKTYRIIDNLLEKANQISSECHNPTIYMHETPPFISNAQLRDYQIDGVNWLLALHHKNTNGILADEMGLGKTIQTIALLGHLKSVNQSPNPHLIVVPKNTIANWLSEINKFCPSMRAISLIGEKAERRLFMRQNIKNQPKNGSEIAWDVLVTSYDMLIKSYEKNVLRKFQWGYVVLDEAHRIKNIDAKISTCVRQFRSTNRLILSGTPLQNNLQELWALLNFLLPEIFASELEFIIGFDAELLSCDETLVQRLHSTLKPFLLRRIKSEVEKSLLPKKEIFLFTELTSLQRDMYKSILTRQVDANNNDLRNMSVSQLQAIFMHLRKCCCHPYMFPKVEKGPPFVTDESIVHTSGKMIILDKLLENLRANGHRCLLFSQFTTMLNIIEDYLIWKRITYFRLDGATGSEIRHQMVNKFNESDEYFIFIISTRAGGLGINLASADTVIFYDNDWNPQVDLQAMDRAHRIGQKNQVMVYRLINQYTVEERMLEVAAGKLNLDQIVIQSHNNSKGPKGVKGPQAAIKLRLGKDSLLSILGQSLDRIAKHSGSDEVFNCDLEKLFAESRHRQDRFEMQFKDENNNENFHDWNKFQITTSETAVRPRQKSAASEFNFDERDLRRRAPKRIDLGEFHFYPAMLHVLVEREQNAYCRAMAKSGEILSAYAGNNADELTPDEVRLKDDLITQGFPQWNRAEFRAFLKAHEVCFRGDFEAISQFIVSKSAEEVKAYSGVFWKRYSELPNYTVIIRRIVHNERMLKQKRTVKAFLGRCFEDCGRLFSRFRPYLRNLEYSNKCDEFSEDEDRFLLFMFAKLNGYENEKSVFKQIRNHIFVSDFFQFDWRFQRCSEDDLRRRCMYLFGLIEGQRSMENNRSLDSNPSLNFVELGNTNDSPLDTSTPCTSLSSHRNGLVKFCTQNGQPNYNETQSVSDNNESDNDYEILDDEDETDEEEDTVGVSQSNQ